MTNIGKDGCDARDTAPEEPHDDLLDTITHVGISVYDPTSVVIAYLGPTLGVTNILLSLPDAQFLARSIYDALEGFDHHA